MSAGTVCVLDYEMSNLRSATKALERLGAPVSVARAPREAEGALAVVLPGVGHFGEAMRRIRRQGLDEVVGRAAAEGTPLLGICLGLQLLYESSEESPRVPGLGVLPGHVRRLRTERKLPHIGWAHVRWVPGSGLGPEGGGEATYYFVHSFAVEPGEDGLALGTAEHGVGFCAAAGRGPVCGVQFHPEKSSRAGLELLGRWLARVGVAGARSAA
jgi:glutamine amidotransferase